MKEVFKEINRLKLYYIICIVFLFLFIFIRIDIFAVLSALFFIIGVITESFVSASSKGIKNEIKEIIIAVIIALVVWNIATYLLNTNMPFNAVVSCSMVDTLHRGDIIVLAGKEPIVNEINLTKSEFDKIIENKEAHFICGICIDEYGRETPCSINPFTLTYEEGEILRYDCDYCKEIVDGSEGINVCTWGVTIKNKYFNATERKGDVIVYSPDENDLFYLVGDIIHRGVVKINVEGEKYYLIKGDNNPHFDTQIYDGKFGRTNSFVSEDRVKGKMIFKLPFLGYVKLVVSGQIANPSGCEIRILYE